MIINNFCWSYMVKKIKKRGGLLIYSPNNSLNNGKRFGWFSRKFRKGLFMDLLLVTLTVKGSDHSVSEPETVSLALTLI